MPTYNLTYTFTVTDLRAKIDEAVSKTAQRAVGKEGQSLYDAIKIYSNDRSVVEDAIRDAMDSVALRFVDMSKIEAGTNAYTLSFYAPDIQTENSETVRREVERYVSMKVVADWLSTRYPDPAKYYSDLADAALAKVVVAVRTRKTPTR